ncbi:hypothetical protein H6F48_18745 [Limnothrix sp. FACHB-1088]|uniref:hypothetical protein n=1 Tax=Limnothrix sp. FACHB-1088 TaxID=2692816 RepID=UPI00168045B7|nr:hypothetical protein [Limnothrix sp. FACHB-1088]MBD2193836.1 hypothetical protein [Limnothrix sp. FACHB-1088]
MPRTPPPPLPPQLDHEPDMAYSLLCEYVQLGRDRSIRALAELTGRSRSMLGGLSIKWQWPDRAAAWDRAHAFASEPSPETVAALGDRKARIAGALDLAIGLIADKLQSADPAEMPARSISSLVSALATCAELADALEPRPLTAEIAAIETLLPSVDPRLANRLASQVQLLTSVFKGNLDASLATINFGDDDGDPDGAIDVRPHT